MSAKLKRRDVLKAAAGAAGLSALSTSASGASASYNWSVFVTQQTHNNYGDTPKQRAEDYISWAFANIRPSDDQDTRSQNIDTPHGRQDWRNSFEAYCPCQTYLKCQYDGLLDWWADYSEADCTYTPSDDSNILITDMQGYCTGGGVAGRSGKYGVAGAGQQLSDLPSSVDRYGDSCAYESMSTVLEEMGHNYQKSGSYNVEQTGNDTSHDGDQYVSPLGEGATGGTNECGDSVANTGKKYLQWVQNCTVDQYWY